MSKENPQSVIPEPYRDPHFDPPPLQEDDLRSQRLNELESSNAMWGWVAGAVVLALVLMFVFTRSPTNQKTSVNEIKQAPAAPACIPDDLSGNVVLFNCGPTEAASALGKYLEENKGYRVRSMLSSSAGLLVIIE